ncbi:hypothetical protein ACFV2X_02560 [Streptomyces sp. NPDC059679]|uniref:hypothetical protein n=1 Tax=Streptomyces sp. NPDC059679 TaxID=3346903 RepID=UPI00369CF4FB
MYEAYAAGDREAIDARFDPGATVWDSAAEPLLLGKADLDRLRDERPAAGAGDGPEETGLDAYDPVIDVFGDLALVRYWLRVDFAPAPDGGRLRLAKTQIPAGTLARATTCQPSPPTSPVTPTASSIPIGQPIDR